MFSQLRRPLCSGAAGIVLLLLIPIGASHATPLAAPGEVPLPVLPAAQAPDLTGTICVNAFADLNANGLRDAAEPAFDNVGVSLIQSGVLIANIYLDGKVAAPCFRGLMPGSYEVVFSTIATSPTTAARVPVTIAAGGRADAVVGVRTIADQARASSGNLNIVLTRQVRLGMALGGALLVMTIMAGLGLVLRNMYALTALR
jgi:hypothetical protein